MLSQFTFRNFKSYKDETILDLQAISGQEFQDSLHYDGYRHNYLPVSVVYGPNGGGKSNVLEALASLIMVVTFPILAISLIAVAAIAIVIKRVVSRNKSKN